MFKNGEMPSLSYLCQLLCEILQIPVFLKTKAHFSEGLFWNAGLPSHPCYTDPYQLYHTVFQEYKGKGMHTPSIHENDFMEQFAVIPVNHDEQQNSVIIIGPTIQHKMNDDWYAQILVENAISNVELAQYHTYWQGLTVQNRHRFLHVCVTAHWLINQEAIEIADVFQSSFQSVFAQRQKENELEIARHREFFLYQEGNNSISQMLDYIRLGDSNELMRQLAKVTNGPIQFEGLSRSTYLRNVKNLAIGGITMASRAAIEGGLNEELASVLCSLHIQHIEELNDLSKVSAAIIGAIVDFAVRVNQFRKSSVSKAVRLSMEYIYLHLYDKIDFEQLSNISGLNPHYLSKRFKHETGLTLTNYIQRERVEEAKRLLDHTYDTLLSIGARLTFYDQAHFVKVFKKHVGITPNQYRNRGK
ncbi:helix-turn-helix domain-containing protein [Paenibacillus oralis]|uniref:Helix-turn-helix domain-containing protein n=1 Tax=Paenibacillus oralis TaxID=2490856 RepID=A0A3P3U2Q7_9BACL|nr:helix-turn-helix domain-containing protein [Paenibacillus oralis]RRJ64627.1 helix-turn-helix domain-containing protein [Paenibacillus oralis]